MKKIFTLVVLLALFWVPTKAQTSMTVPYGSFEQWDSHTGYGVSIFGATIPIFGNYSTPTGWYYLTYPINESLTLYPGMSISINTQLPLILTEETTTSVPAGNKAAKLESFMLEDIVDATAYALMSTNLDSTLTQTVFPSILCNGTINLENFMPIISSLFSNFDSVASLITALDTIDVNHLITGGLALGTFEPSRLTGSYKYQAADTGDNGGVVILGTHYNTTTNTRNVVGVGANVALTNTTNYTPFTVDYQSIHELIPTEPEQTADSLIILILSSASPYMQQGSTLCIDNLVLWHDSVASGTDSCASIVGLTTTPDIHEAVLNWSAATDVSGYELEYGDAGFALGSGTRVMLTSNTHSFTNLDANTSYDVYLRTVCSSTLYGDWSTLQFTTLPDTCASIREIYVTNQVVDAFPMMVIEWYGSSQPDHWEVEYGPQGFALGQGTLVSTHENFFEIYPLEQDGSLQPNTWYDFYVRSVCEDSVYGEWDSVQYRTFCASVDGLTVHSDSISVNSSNLIEGYKVTWVDTTDTQEWSVGYGETSNPIPDMSGYATTHEPVYYLPALRPNKRYYVEVIAYCGDGNYGEARWVYINTPVVGIEETDALSLSVYPNPASGSCEVSLSSGEPAELNLFSLDGRLLQTLHTTGGAVELQLPAAGLFLLQATTASGTTTRKIISK